jgi:hypothetical protein
MVSVEHDPWVIWVKTTLIFYTAHHAVNGKGNVVPIDDINAYLRMEVKLQEFLTSALDEGGWSASCVVLLCPLNMRPADLKTGLGALEKRTSLFHEQKSDHYSSVVRTVAKST